jgi:UDP-N-acetylglucosamine 2-epimerase
MAEATVARSRGERAKLTVPVVVGTRPEAFFHPLVVSTGQHHQTVEEIFELAEIRTDVELLVGGVRSRLNERVAEAMNRFEDLCHDWFGAEGAAVASTSEVLRGDFPARG